jgi:hypothetical protein
MGLRMRLYTCDHCHSPIHFDNRVCGTCGYRLGFVTETLTLHAMAMDYAGARWQVLHRTDASYRFCANASLDLCNWLVPAPSAESYCVACRYNRLVPDADTQSGFARWRAIAHAQRHLFYSLLRWDLPRPTRAEDPVGGLAFDLKEDEPRADGSCAPVMMGHDEGVIIIRAAEADDLTREKVRHSLNEPYRTLLGHFRHEIGHFYWTRLVEQAGKLWDFRAMFGDERQDYDAALKTYYANGAKPGWQNAHISAYASAHPWEDFAETFAHCLHIVDSMETAHAYGLSFAPYGQKDYKLSAPFDPYGYHNFADMARVWAPLSEAINSLHHSMGESEFYPFSLCPTTIDKLGFVHNLIIGTAFTAKTTVVAENAQIALRSEDISG